MVRQKWFSEQGKNGLSTEENLFGSENEIGWVKGPTGLLKVGKLKLMTCGEKRKKSKKGIVGWGRRPRNTKYFRPPER